LLKALIFKHTVFPHHCFSLLYRNSFHLLTNFQTLYFPNWRRNAKECHHCHQWNWYHSLSLKVRILYLFQSRIRQRTRLDIVVTRFYQMVLFCHLLYKKSKAFRPFFSKFLRKYLLVLINVYLNSTCISNQQRAIPQYS